ncbi:MAG: acetate--CoA ligase family protein [Candidatus Bipolaricaulia bacterium]
MRLCHLSARGGGFSSQASQSIAFSHTAALASDDRIVTGALRQAGIVRAASFEEAVAIAQGLTLPPVRVEEIMGNLGTPIALCVFAQRDEAQELQQELSIPVFTEIEAALCGLAASRTWHQRRERPTAFSKTVPSARACVTLCGEAILAAERALQLCQEYGIPVARWEVAETPEAAVCAAERLGYPVALKIISSEIVHKTDVGGVVLNLSSAEAVHRAAQALLTRFAAKVMIQQMVTDGVELIIGGKRDPAFGPVVMIGLGGIFTEIFDDVAFRVAPLTLEDAEEMLAELRGRSLLEKVRGRAALDRAALVQAILAVSQLIAENGQIAELDINPLVVLPSGVLAVDARVLLTTDATASRATPS